MIQFNLLLVVLLSAANFLILLHLVRLSETLVMVSENEKPDPSSSDTICNEIVNGELSLVTVQCNYNNRDPPNRRGKYVTIQRKSNAAIAKHLLNFCEVEIFSCPPGWWGRNLSGTPDCSMELFQLQRGGKHVEFQTGTVYTGM